LDGAVALVAAWLCFIGVGGVGLAERLRGLASVGETGSSMAPAGAVGGERFKEGAGRKMFDTSVSGFGSWLQTAVENAECARSLGGRTWDQMRKSFQAEGRGGSNHSHALKSTLVRRCRRPLRDA